MDKFQKEDEAAAVVQALDASRAPELNPPALARLAPKERLCLHLWAQEDCSPAEIASVLGCSRNTAGVHLHRARKKLRFALREEKHV